MCAVVTLLGAVSAGAQTVATKRKIETGATAQMTPQPPGRFTNVNGLKLYYEIHGEVHSRAPLVLLHGGGSTIESTYARLLPLLANSRQIIAIELQAHGHTADINRPLSFEQDAHDVAELLNQLRVNKADIMGFSNGGTTALQIAIRHAQMVKKLVLASATYRRDGMPQGFWDGFQHASLDSMPKPLQQAYLKANPDPKGLQAMFDRDVARMKAFKDIPDAQIQNIQAPALVLNGDHDVVLPQHALQLSKTLPHARLAILPSGHGDYMGEVCATDGHSPTLPLVAALIEDFLND
jgi:pimeloyl-ACP methyl ester carboxylesterase